MKRNRFKGQSFLEYSMLVFCLCLALVAMSSYLKRAVTGGLRETAADGDQHFDPVSATSFVRVIDAGRQQNTADLSWYDFNFDGQASEDEYASVSTTTIPAHAPAQRVTSGTEKLCGPLADDKLF